MPTRNKVSAFSIGNTITSESTDVKVVAKGRGNVASYAPIFSTTSISTVNQPPAVAQPDSTPAIPSAPTSSGGGGTMQATGPAPIAGGFLAQVPQWVYIALAAGLAFWFWKRKKG